MLCPDCGKRMVVRSTREVEDSRVLRYRLCKHCGITAPTLERVLCVARPTRVKVEKGLEVTHV